MFNKNGPNKFKNNMNVLFENKININENAVGATINMQILIRLIKHNLVAVNLQYLYYILKRTLFFKTWK